MKTKEDYQKAIDEIANVCKKHGIFLIGTCETEGIYGEITIGDVAEPDTCGWVLPGDMLTNKIEYRKDIVSINGIGEI